MAGGCEARWRVKEWTKKFNPAVDNPTVAVPKPKPKGNEGVKVRRSDEGRPGVPMGDHEGSRGMKAGSWEGRRRESPPRKPKKEVGSTGRGGRITRGEAERSRQRNWERRDGEVGGLGVEECRRRAGERRYWARRPRAKTMVESKASAGKPEPGSRGRSGNKTAKGGKARR